MSTSFAPLFAELSVREIASGAALTLMSLATAAGVALAALRAHAQGKRTA